MPPFPWDSLKADTLRSICKDLGENLGKREDMVIFLKEVETRGLSSTSQAVVPATHLPVVSNDRAPKPGVTKVPSRDRGEDSDDDMDSDETGTTGDKDTDGCPGSDESTCPCTDEFSPRMKFILCTVAGVASDLVRDTGELAGELGHVGGVYMTGHIPHEETPLGKKAAAQWVEGLSTIYHVICEIFTAGRIPTEPALLEALGKLSKFDRTLINAYTEHTEVGRALSALVQQAKQEWKDEFQEIYCDGEEWHKLPTCAKHDLDWTMAEDMLVG